MTTEMTDASRLEAVEDAVMAMQRSIHSIESFARNMQGSSQVEEMAAAVKGLMGKVQSLEDTFRSSQSSSCSQSRGKKSQDLELWIKVNIMKSH